MSAQEMARKSYKHTQKTMGSDAELELKVFMDITARLAKSDPNKPGGITELNQAISDNIRLWKIIFIDVTNKENQLPENLKASLVYLADFTFAHSQKVLQGEAGVDILVEINENIIAGKRTFLSGEKDIEAA